MRSLVPSIVFAALSLVGCGAPTPATPPTAHVTPFTRQEWRPMDPSHPQGPQVAVLWGDMKGPTAFLFRVPAGYEAGLHSHSDDYYGTVVTGQPAHGMTREEASPQEPGSTWFQPHDAVHYDRCTGSDGCVLMLVFPHGPVDFLPAKGSGR